MLVMGGSVAAQEKDNEQLTNELSALQRNVTEMRADMRKLQRLLDNRAMLELFQRVDELEQEAGELRGLLEQQQHDLAGIKKRQRELYLDIDRRLRELEITTPAQRAPAPVAPVTPAPAPAPTPSGGSSTTAPDVSLPTPAPTPAPVPALGTSKPKPATISGGRKPRVPVSDEREAYQKAFDLLKEGRYAKANAALKGFLQKYPQGAYAGNAQYWLGESNYVTRQFEQAVVEFKKVLNTYPDSNKVPDAMLKLGYTHYELAQFTEARDILSQLKQRAPKSTAARLADKRLQRMKSEGR
jgi:tol-pal system protein YbgF